MSDMNEADLGSGHSLDVFRGTTIPVGSPGHNSLTNNDVNRLNYLD